MRTRSTHPVGWCPRSPPDQILGTATGASGAGALAAAGVRRLGFEDRIAEYLSPDVSLPAIAQGAVGIECRIGDEDITSLIAPLRHDETEVCVGAERAILKRLEGGCQVPIAAHAVLKGDTLVIDALVGNIEGDVILRAHREGPASEAEALGIDAAEELLSKGGKEILDEIYGAEGPQVNR